MSGTITFFVLFYIIFVSDFLAAVSFLHPIKAFTDRVTLQIRNVATWGVIDWSPSVCSYCLPLTVTALQSWWIITINSFFFQLTCRMFNETCLGWSKRFMVTFFLNLVLFYVVFVFLLWFCLIHSSISRPVQCHSLLSHFKLILLKRMTENILQRCSYNVLFKAVCLHLIFLCYILLIILTCNTKHWDVQVLPLPTIVLTNSVAWHVKSVLNWHHCDVAICSGLSSLKHLWETCYSKPYFFRDDYWIISVKIQLCCPERNSIIVYLGEALQMFYFSYLVFMARDSSAEKMVCGVSVSSSFALSQMGGGTYSMGSVLPKTQLKVLKC